MAKEAGLKVVKRISVPLSTEQYNELDVARAKKGKYMLNTLRDLVIFQK